jgi:hypothetical protein
MPVTRGFDRGRGAYYGKWLLDRRARATYLREWYYTLRRMIRKNDIGPFRRELAGALQYWLARLLHADPVPAFDSRASVRSHGR